MKNVLYITDCFIARGVLIGDTIRWWKYSYRRRPYIVRWWLIISWEV